MKVRPGIVPVVSVNVGAGLFQRDRFRLQLGNQGEGSPVYPIEPAVAVLGVCKYIIPTFVSYRKGLLSPLILQAHSSGWLGG